MFPIVTAINKCDSAEITNVLMDSLIMLGNAHMSFNFVGRGEMRLEMKKVRPLANKETPVSTLLFRDDIDGEKKNLTGKKNSPRQWVDALYLLKVKPHTDTS